MPSALPGFRDFYPAELAERAHVMRIWREVARRYGFVEYDGPPLEPLDLYTKKSGDEIVGQLFDFVDKGGRHVSLRPEMTPTFARMVAAKANALRKPVRWFSTPQLFRYERTQKGRLREHFQLNVDIVGEEGPAADAEVLSFAIDIMRGLGLGPGDVRARVSDRRLLAALLDALGVSAESHGAVYAVIDKLERQPREVSEEKLAAAGLDAGRIATLLELVATHDLDVIARRFPEHAGVASAAATVREYLGYLARLGVADWVVLDLAIVRGLAYYTGIVFELFDAQGEFRAICGGGRYDNLLDALGGVKLPALGFGMGDVVLSELLKARGKMPSVAPRIDWWVLDEEGELTEAVLSLAAALRGRGRSVEYALRQQKFDKQLKAATAAGAVRVAVVRRSGVVTVRAEGKPAVDHQDVTTFLEAEGGGRVADGDR